MVVLLNVGVMTKKEVKTMKMEMLKLVSRANSVGNVMLQHVDWKEDSMIITFPKHKGDQTGEGLSNDKHVYANPLMPEICPILALAVLVFLHSSWN